MKKFNQILIFNYINIFSLLYSIIMPPFVSDIEQMNTHELTSKQVLRLLGCDDGKHKVEKEYSIDAVNAARASGDYINIQLYQYVLYKKNAHGGWDKVKIDKNWFRGTGLNAYAICGDNGIVITRPLNLSNDKKHDLNIPNKKSDNNNNSADSGKIINDSSNNNESNTDENYEPADGQSSGSNYEVKSYAGNDQEVIQRVSFVKLCLLKDIYECLTATVL